MNPSKRESLNLATARRIASAALDKRRELGLKPICVAVLDSGGHLVLLEREDGASLLRPEIAVGKAWGALALGISSRQIGVMAVERPTFIASLASMAERGIVPAAGGVQIVDRTGGILGAVGVSGDTSDNDETCALAGIRSAELEAIV